MRKSRFIEAQIIGMIKEQGGRNAYGGGVPQGQPYALAAGGSAPMSATMSEARLAGSITRTGR